MRILAPILSEVRSTDTRTPASASFAVGGFGGFEGLLGDREDADLLGREPERELAGEVLDEHADEALQLPNGARWIITGRCGLLSAPM